MLPEPARKRFRKLMTGSEEVRLRDHIRENSEKIPQFVKTTRDRIRDETRKRIEEVKETLKLRPVIKLMDRFVFFVGVVTLLLTEAVLLITPHYFSSWYALTITPVLLLRFNIYKKVSENDPSLPGVSSALSVAPLTILTEFLYDEEKMGLFLHRLLLLRVHFLSTKHNTCT